MNADSTPRYDAFISYSHADAEIAQRLAERLSRYRVPKGCGVTRRPLRVFLDVDRLTTHPNLGEALRERIAASDHLVLLASSASAQSRYVDQEAAAFLQDHDAAEMMIALAAGDTPIQLPPSVRAATAEPLYADLSKRPGVLANRKWFRAESLRVIASVLGVDYDTLHQRDTRRRRRLVAAVGIAAGALMLTATSAWLISGIPAESWVRIQAPRESTDSDLLVVRNVAVNQTDPGEILFRAQDNRNYVNELEVAQIRDSDGDEAADEHFDSFLEGWDAVWAEWHVLRADPQSGGFVEDGHGEERWETITAPDNPKWAWYQPPDRQFVRDGPAGYREEDPFEPALRAILTQRVPKPEEWWDRSREVIIVTRSGSGGEQSVATLRDIFTRQMGVTQTRSYHFLKEASDQEWREIHLTSRPEGTTIEDVRRLDDNQVVLVTDRAGLFMAASPTARFDEFNLGVRDLETNPALQLVVAGRPPELFVLAPPQVTGEHASTGSLWRYQRDGIWARLKTVLSGAGPGSGPRPPG